MRIGFIGAPSTGKSTLAKQVSEKLKIPLVFEFARYYISKKDWDQPLDQRQIWKGQYALEEAHKDFSTEGCLLNNIFYSQLCNQFCGDLPIPRYTHLFWLPERPKVEPDGIRVGLYLTNEFLALFNSFVEENAPKWGNVVKLGLENRLENVLENL